MNRSVNEIFRMLSVLIERQYIEFDEDSSNYALSLKTFVLSNQYPPTAQLLKRARPMMEELCAKVSQSCHLSQYYNGELVVIGAQESPYKMGFGVRLGASIDVCSSGSGTVLLAYSSNKKRQDIIEKSNATQDEIDYVLSHMDETAQNGYYVGASPQISGVTNISFPIFGALGDIMAIITVPYMTLNSQTVHHHIEDIENTRLELRNVAKNLCQNFK